MFYVSYETTVKTTLNPNGNGSIYWKFQNKRKYISNGVGVGIGLTDQNVFLVNLKET